MSTDTSDSRPPSSDASGTQSNSESENPAIDSPEPKAHAPLRNQDWWPEQVDVSVLHRQSEKGNPLGEDFDYAEEFAKLDVDALKADVLSVITTSQDWWPADYGSYAGLFIRMSWHAAGTYRIFDGRGGGGQGSAALRSAEQLARQRQPRQGPPPAVAGQAEVRQQDLLGRPDRVRRQRRAGVGRLRDVRLRLRSRGHLGAGGDPLRPGGHLAGHRQALLPASVELAEPLRRHHHGPDLRQSRRPGRQAGSAGRRPRHPRDVRPDGDERRGDRRADRRRPHPRQDPRRR